MMINSRKTEAKDIHKIVLRDLFKSEVDAKESFLASTLFNSAVMATILVDQQPVIILRGAELFNGVFDLSALTSDDVTKTPLALCREIRRLERDAVKRFGIHRLQATVRFGETQAALFLEHFGFEVEALMKKYGPDGADYWLYAKVF